MCSTFEPMNGMAERRRSVDHEFLVKDEIDRITFPKTSWWHGVFFFSFVGIIACIITLWAPYPVGARMTSEQVAATPWSEGCHGVQTCICPRETVCADDVISMALLTIARCSAWFDYPLYMILFLSKAHNLNNFLQTTTLRIFINFSDYHMVHRVFGTIVGFESTCHGFMHILRWTRRRNDIQLLWTSQTGITGMLAFILCPLVVLPMTLPYLKKKVSFEWRKGLHFLSILWGIGLMLHAPQRIFWLIGIPFFVYVADKLFGAVSKTYLIENAYFEKLSDSVCLITFENPPSFGKQNAAYTYLMLPWISKFQLHAFTVFPSLDKCNHSSICISKAGTWTGDLINQITSPTHRVAFVAGPFLSPFSSPAMDSDNLLLVALGIGVTPAISLIKKYTHTLRCINLVWICKDPGLIEYMIKQIDFCGCGYALIYYTGTSRTLVIDEDVQPNVIIFAGRPKLQQTLSGIIYATVTGDALPEELCMNQEVVTKAPPVIRAKLLIEKAITSYTVDHLFECAAAASYIHEAKNNEQVPDEEPRHFASQLEHSNDFESTCANKEHTQPSIELDKSEGTKSTDPSTESFASVSKEEDRVQRGRFSIENTRVERFVTANNEEVPRLQPASLPRLSRAKGTAKELDPPRLTNCLPMTRSMLSRLGSNRTMAAATRGLSYSFGTRNSSSKVHVLIHDRVNYQGLLSTMKKLLGEDYEFITKELEDNFKTLRDKNKLDRKDFAELIRNMTQLKCSVGKFYHSSTLSGLPEPSILESGHGISSHGVDEFHIRKVLQGDGQFSAGHWSMLFCGSCQPIVDDLEAYKRKFGIGLSIEKFDW